MRINKWNQMQTVCTLNSVFKPCFLSNKVHLSHSLIKMFIQYHLLVSSNIQYSGFFLIKTRVFED